MADDTEPVMRRRRPVAPRTGAGTRAVSNWPPAPDADKAALVVEVEVDHAVDVHRIAGIRARGRHAGPRFGEVYVRCVRGLVVGDSGACHGEQAPLLSLLATLSSSTYPTVATSGCCCGEVRGQDGLDGAGDAGGVATEFARGSVFFRAASACSPTAWLWAREPTVNLGLLAKLVKGRRDQR